MNLEKLIRKVTHQVGREHWRGDSSTTYSGTTYHVKTVLWRHWYGLAWSYTISYPNLEDGPRIVRASRLYLGRDAAKHDAIIAVGHALDAIYDASRSGQLTRT